MLAQHTLDARHAKGLPARRSRLRVHAPHACLQCAQQQSLLLLQGRMLNVPQAAGAQCSTSGRSAAMTTGEWRVPQRRRRMTAFPAQQGSGDATGGHCSSSSSSSSSSASSSWRMHAVSVGSSSSESEPASQQHSPGEAGPAAANPAGSVGDSASEAQLISPPSTKTDQRPPATPPPDAGDHDSLGVRAALGALRFYKQGISPLMPSVCRYLPTCSQYSVDAYKSYGVARGTVLTAWRLLRCNPWGGKGYDPVAWPPPGLPAAVFQLDGSAEVAVVVGLASFVWLVQSALFG